MSWVLHVCVSVVVICGWFVNVSSLVDGFFSFCLQIQCPGSRAREDAVWMVSSEFKDL